MIVTKARATAVALAASASIAIASLAPASSQAYSTVRPVGSALFEAATCYYNGQPYSQGAQVKQDDGLLHECMSNGAWSAGHS
jgi:TPR repeat protein